jgi:tetratricopeptide (TPR) repeat protein
MNKLGGMTKNAWISLAAVCALVIGVYSYESRSGPMELLTANAADTYYNLLVQGFQAGQLGLKKEAPPGLAQLADPYDPSANAPYRVKPYGLHDVTYYKGRLYLYFGVVPALILFWPYAVLTGHYLFHREAVLIFCSIGFLASVGLLCAFWRRYFAEVSVAVIAACALALGLATGVPVLLSRSEVYEVAITCGYMLTMLALAAIWRALHEPRNPSGWLAIASLVYGLAIGARPPLLFGAVILLVPVEQAWRKRQRVWSMLLAAMGPIACVGLGLMIYNARRFGSPFEFGHRYQLVLENNPALMQNFSLRYLWFNFRLYFLQPAGWSLHFPFIRKLSPPPLPRGLADVERPFGILTNVPLVWLALVAPLAWKGRSIEDGLILRRFAVAITILFAICAITLCLFCYTCVRYEVEFLPELLLLAAIGILGLERALAQQSTWRCVARWVWVSLLAFSVVFNLLASVDYHVEAHNILGIELLQTGKVPEAAGEFEQALGVNPRYAQGHYNLGCALELVGKPAEAIQQYEQAVQLEPDFLRAHYNLGCVLAAQQDFDGAIKQYQEALRILPDSVDAPQIHNNLGIALASSGKINEAIEHFQQALRLRPNFDDARLNLERAQKLEKDTGNGKATSPVKP